MDLEWERKDSREGRKRSGVKKLNKAHNGKNKDRTNAKATEMRRKSKTVTARKKQ